MNTFSDFLDELLSDRNFLMESDDDERLVIPLWNQCLNNEFNIRKDAVRLCMEEGFALKDALWHVLADKEHRMQHWILKLTIANARQDTSKVQKLEQRLAALEMQRRRSRSPRRQAQRALPAQHALPAKRTGRNRKGNGKGKNHKSEFRLFRQLFRIPSARKLFQENICWKFQSNLCKDANCSRKHACVGCGKADTQYDSCGCLESKI